MVAEALPFIGRVLENATGDGKIAQLIQNRADSGRRRGNLLTSILGRGIEAKGV